MAKNAKGGGKSGKRSRQSGGKRSATATKRRSLQSLPVRGAEDAGLVNVVIETSKGSPNKLGYEDSLGAFTLHAVLPQGAVFPFDFGFIPSTEGGDGDPLDVLVLMEAPVPAGTVVPTRLVGVIAAEERETDGEAVTNDRLIGVAPACALYRGLKKLDELPAPVVDEIEQFFTNYAEQQGKEFRPKGRSGARRAATLVEEGERRARR